MVKMNQCRICIEYSSKGNVNFITEFQIMFSHLTNVICLVFQNVSEEGLTVLVGKKVAVHQIVCNHNQS